MKLRFLIGIVLLQGVSLPAQQTLPTVCTGGYHPQSSILYGIDVWNKIMLTEKGGSSIEITISENFSKKFILRAKGSNYFEILRFEPNENVFRTLQNLEDTCRLPGNPADAAGLLNIHWESEMISASQFERIHKGFIEALKGYVLDSQSKYRPSLDGEGTILLHATEWNVTYHNSGYEYFDVRIDERKDKSGKLLALPLWAQQTVNFAESSFLNLTKPESPLPTPVK